MARGVARLGFAAVGPFVDHANIGLRLPGLRWLIPNPEWHHWHHASAAIGCDGSEERTPWERNFSPFPFVDLMFGTAYMPAGRRPSAYGAGIDVPATGYLRQLAFPVPEALCVGTH